MKNLKKRSKRNLLIGFGFSLLILILSSVLSYVSIMKLLESQKLVDHTVEVETGLNKLISAMKDAETGQRGFLLSGEETFLEPYNGTRTEVMDSFNSAQLLTRDNQAQQKDFPVLQALIQTKFDLLNASIANKKRGIPPTMTDLSKGKVVMDSIRTVVATMISRENKLLQSRNEEMSQFATFTPITIWIAALISMVITILFYFKVNSDAKRTIELQKELLQKEEDTAKQIEAISDIAKKIAGGDYGARVDKTE